MKIATFLYASLLSASFIFASSNTDSLSSGKTTSWSVKQCQEKLDLLNKEIPAEALDAKITLAEVQAKEKTRSYICCLFSKELFLVCRTYSGAGKNTSFKKISPVFMAKKNGCDADGDGHQR